MQSDYLSFLSSECFSLNAEKWSTPTSFVLIEMCPDLYNNAVFSLIHNFLFFFMWKDCKEKQKLVSASESLIGASWFSPLSLLLCMFIPAITQYWWVLNSRRVSLQVLTRNAPEGATGRTRKNAFLPFSLSAAQVLHGASGLIKGEPWLSVWSGPACRFWPKRALGA